MKKLIPILLACIGLAGYGVLAYLQQGKSFAKTSHQQFPPPNRCGDLTNEQWLSGFLTSGTVNLMSGKASPIPDKTYLGPLWGWELPEGLELYSIQDNRVTTIGRHACKVAATWHKLPPKQWGLMHTQSTVVSREVSASCPDKYARTITVAISAKMLSDVETHQHVVSSGGEIGSYESHPILLMESQHKPHALERAVQPVLGKACSKLGRKALLHPPSCRAVMKLRDQLHQEADPTLLAEEFQLDGMLKLHHIKFKSGDGSIVGERDTAPCFASPF
jgi:hypothetical protein